MRNMKTPCVKSVLLDTSFLITLLNDARNHHKTATDYFYLWTTSKVTLYASTIVIAEYSVKGKLEDFVMQHLTVLPFNYDHALKTGELVATQAEAKKNNIWPLVGNERDAVKDDLKLFAQTHLTDSHLLATADEGMPRLADFFRSEGYLAFDILPLWEPFNHDMATTGERGLL